nr:MAG TPA: hypothetical protein [Bacteriophage sp.]
MRVQISSVSPYGLLAQQVRAADLKFAGTGFDSLTVHHLQVSAIGTNSFCNLLDA